MALDFSQLGFEEKRRALSLLREKERRVAQKDILALGQRLTGFNPPRHQKVMGRVMQMAYHTTVDYYEGRSNKKPIQRVMLFAPPRHTKSWTTSWFAPVYFFGQNPRLRIMHLTHTDTFAQKMGNRIRNTIDSPVNPYDKLKLARHTRAKTDWMTTLGGEYAGFGMNGSPTGRPADILIMDDIVKGRKEAKSDVTLDNIWDIYSSDVLTRLEGPQIQILTITRWSEDDPAGRILPVGYNGESGLIKDRITGDVWLVICMPAVAEHPTDPLKRKPGEWLWPEEHGPDREIGAQRKRGGTTWSALYQQRPTPEDGTFFLKKDFRHYQFADLFKGTKGERLIDRLAVYISSDYATKREDGTDPDFTVHTVWGVDENWNVFVLDQWCGKERADKWVQVWLALVKKWGVSIAAEERGQIINSVGPFLQQKMIEEKVFCHRRQFTSSMNKVARAQSLSALYGEGRVFHPQGPECDWVEPFENELLKFPNASHDDRVDSGSLFAHMLGRIMRGDTPKKTGKTPAEEQQELLRELEEEDR
ncbi:MAG: phage terminase large subunit [Pseudomonadota bacterium]